MPTTDAQKTLLKDILFNKTKVTNIAQELHSIYPSFQKTGFIKKTVDGFVTRELKERITWIAACLHEYLPSSYPKALHIILDSLPPPNDPTKQDNDFGDFIYAAYLEYVARYGCTKKYLRLSLEAIHALTQRFSAEDAIRYFINAFPQETYTTLTKWAIDDHYHVRRLCSEGTRPSLPWSKKIKTPIEAAIPLLNILYKDTTRYVTRSVANHINDIAKKQPELALTTLNTWQQEQGQHPKEIAYIIKHGLRTLIKQGHTGALACIGITPSQHITITQWHVPKTVYRDTHLTWSFNISSQESTNLVIDYAIYYQTKQGKKQSKKIYKLKTITIKKGETINIKKSHLLKKQMTTRTIYQGEHAIELLINGIPHNKTTFIVQ